MFPYFEVDYVATKLYVWHLGFCGFLFCMTSSMFNILYSWICYFYKSYVATKKWSLPSVVCLYSLICRTLHLQVLATPSEDQLGCAGLRCVVLDSLFLFLLKLLFLFCFWRCIPWFAELNIRYYTERGSAGLASGTTMPPIEFTNACPAHQPMNPHPSFASNSTLGLVDRSTQLICIWILICQHAKNLLP